MCFENRRQSTIPVILCGTNLSPCHPIQGHLTRTYNSFLAGATPRCLLDPSDPNGQPTIHPSKTTNSTAITWKKLSHDLLTPEGPSSTLTPTDIDQNIINDCSLCASVAICIQHNQRFNSRVCFLLTHLLSCSSAPSSTHTQIAIVVML